ncbi:glycosyltransferase family 2 protein [Candidatus Pelagibacter sp. HIMB1517]|uniref:glycosyltransferase family 2 protein n=1 Tax=Candidatus Pelagibacter sp. HIMB1517 TaxID=3413341 RepID=UPI003F832F3A
MKLTIIIPIFNESKTILKLLQKIESIKNLEKQLILVDDFSSDNSIEIIESFNFSSDKTIIKHKKNLGKGACIISALKYIHGDLVIIQDADLEYDPNDYYKLVDAFQGSLDKVVYGSRMLGNKKNLKNKFTSRIRIFANYILTKISNIINNQNLTDAHTCYKIFPKDIFLKLELSEKGFNFCPEVTTKIANMKIKIIEVPISYNGRTVKEGKKIKFKDAIIAFYTIMKYKKFKL